MPELGRWQQRHLELKAIWCYIARPYLKINKFKKRGKEVGSERRGGEDREGAGKTFLLVYGSAPNWCEFQQLVTRLIYEPPEVVLANGPSFSSLSFFL